MPAVPLPLLLIGLVAGLIAGSFIGALTWRWPRGLAVGHGRSMCDACGATLSWRDLVPLLSWLANRRRCRQCGAAIGSRHSWIELAAAAVGAIAAIATPDMITAATLALFGWWLLALIILDIEHYWLPDRLTLPLLAAGLLAAAWTAPSLPDRLVGAALGYALPWTIAAAYRALRGRQGMGGGDAKLLAALGAWLGVAAVPLLLAGAAVLGLLLVGIDRMAGRKVGGGDKVAFGALLAAAAWPMALARPALVMQGWWP